MSLVAAGSIYCYRKNKGLIPTWPKQLKSITKYNEDELSDVIKDIIAEGKHKNRVLGENTLITNGGRGKRLLNVYELYMNC